MSSESPQAVDTADLLPLFKSAVHGRYGVRLAFLDKDRADAAATKLRPSYRLHGPKKSLHLVYLVADEGERLKAIVDEVRADEDDDAYVEFDVVAPDAKDYHLHEDSAAHLVSGGAFDVVKVDEVEAKLFPVESGMDADAVEGQTRHDVEIRNGPIKLEFLQKQVRVARAPSKDQSYWAVSPEMPFGDVLAQRFGKHVSHPVKDNWATVFASLIPIKDHAELKKIDAQTKWKTTRKADNGAPWPVKTLPAGYHWATRTKNTVGAIYALGIDIDDGTRFEDACASVEKLDTLALLYTTHSHGSRSLDFSYPKLRAWSEANGTIIEKEDLTTEHVRAFLTAEGKYKPHVIASARFNRWEQTPRGFLVFVDIDPIDKLRIVFLLDKPYDIASFKMEFRDIETQWREIVLGVGKMLDVKPDKAATDLCRLFFEPRHHPNRPDAKIVIYAGGKLLDWEKVERVKEERGGAVGKKASDHYVVEGIDLRVWAKHFAGDFLPTKLLDAHCDDRIRVRQTDVKYTVECPHDQDHSNVGDPNDKGGFVADADDKAFFWGCSHESCKGRDRDRLDQIKKAILDGWFPSSALFDPEFSNLAEGPFADALAGFEADNAKAIKRKGKQDDKAKRIAGDGPARIRLKQDFEDRREELREALMAANEPEPRLFQTKGLHRRLNAGGDLSHLDAKKFKTECDRAATYVVIKKVDDKFVEEGVPVAQADIDFWLGHDDRLFPELAGVRNAPAHSATGHLRTKSGYDPDTNYLYQLDGLVIPPVDGKDWPKALDILVNDVLGDFPFSDDISGAIALTPFVNNRNRIGCEEGKSSRAHALAAILHPFVAGLIDGPSPAYFFEKPEAGTGASLLAEVVSRISTGRPAPMQTLTKPDELRKELLSKLVKGRSLIVLDNIPESGLRGDVLASFLTASTFSGRLLGWERRCKISPR